MYLNGIKSILLSNREIHFVILFKFLLTNLSAGIVPDLENGSQTIIYDNCFHLAKVSCLDHDMTAPVNSIC